ncbi:MAG: hypothetical protein AAFU61_13115, partial [Pseudomonadota bacterium]
MVGEIWARMASAGGGAGALAASAAAGWAAEGQAVAALLAAGAVAWAWPRPRPAAAPPPAVSGERAERGGLRSGLGLAALQRLPVAVLLIDGAGRVVYANPAATGLFERLAVNEHYSATFRSPDFLDSLAEAMDHGVARDFEFALHGDRPRNIAVHIDAATLREAGGPAAPPACGRGTCRWRSARARRPRAGWRRRCAPRWTTASPATSNSPCMATGP